MDKIIKGKLVLPPYLTPDARDLAKKVGLLLIQGLVSVSSSEPCQQLCMFDWLSLGSAEGHALTPPACAVCLWEWQTHWLWNQNPEFRPGL